MKNVIVFAFILFCLGRGLGIWEPLVKCSATGSINKEGIDFELLSFEKVPHRIQYRGFFTKGNEEISCLFIIEGRSLVQIDVGKKYPEGFSLTHLSEDKSKAFVYDIIEDDNYVLELGETVYKKDSFVCKLREISNGKIYIFSDKKRCYSDEGKSFRVIYKENVLLLVLQRKGEFPLVFTFILES